MAGKGLTRGQRTHERHTPSVSNQWPRGPTPEPYAAAAPLGPAARSRVRGADSLAQALDLLANPHRIVDDRRLGDQTRVVQVEEARAVARATVCGAVARARGLSTAREEAALQNVNTPSVHRCLYGTVTGVGGMFQNPFLRPGTP